MVPIGALVESVKTWNPSRDPDNEFEYIDLSAVDNVNKSVTTATPTIGSQAPSRARQLVASGDILVSTVRPNLNAVAVVPPELHGATASTGFTVLRSGGELNGRFLFHWVRTSQFVGDMVRKATGASYPAVSDRIVKDSTIPLPPLPEQRRIAAILDHADALRAKRRQVLTHLDALTQSIFHDMFGSQAWSAAPLGELASTRLGKMLDTKRQTGANSRPYLRNANVQWFSFALDDLLEMDFDERERNEFALTTGDVLVCEGGQPGRSAIWRGERTNVYFQKALHRVRLGDELLPDYFAHFMWKAVHGGALKDLVTSATIAHLTGEKLRTLKVPVPPLALQREFEAQAAQVTQGRDLASKALAEDDGLFASLQSRAFRGEL